MIHYKVYQICSIYSYRMTTSKISMYEGAKRYYQQVKHLQKWSWKECTSQNCRILFSFKLFWLCMTKQLFKKNATELFKIEDSCKTSYRSSDENSKLQSPK